MPGTVCNHWLQQIDPLSTVHRRVRHVPRRRGGAVDQLEIPRRPGCPRGFQQLAQHGCTAQERRERANRPPDHHSPSAPCASTAAEMYLELARHEVPARDTQFRTPAGTPGVYEWPGAAVGKRPRRARGTSWSQNACFRPFCRFYQLVRVRKSFLSGGFAHAHGHSGGRHHSPWVPRGSPPPYWR